mgnify:CR=1 FL=1
MKNNSFYYHITKKKNITKIKNGGLKIRKPKDMEDEVGIYLFKSRESAEEALMNWLGERFDEEEELVILTISPKFVTDISITDAEFEVISKKNIPIEAIVNIEHI